MPESSTIGTDRIILMALVGGLLMGALYETISGDPDSASRNQTAGAASTDTVNVLTEAERTAGWRLLFDGSSLDGWRGYQRDSVPGGWTIDDAALHFTGDGEHSTTIVTTGTYDDFDLRIEWKIAPNGNSGIMYRATEVADDPYRTGPEYQVLDNSTLDSTAGSPHQAGALYGLYAPATDVTRPVGQYNEARIVVNGARVEHWLNGTRLLTADLGSEEWNERIAGTKFAKYEAFAEAEAGHIALQDHGHPVWFRDVKLRPLTPES